MSCICNGGNEVVDRDGDDDDIEDNSKNDGDDDKDDENRITRRI